jgi:hypothetical protein
MEMRRQNRRSSLLVDTGYSWGELYTYIIGSYIFGDNMQFQLATAITSLILVSYITFESLKFGGWYKHFEAIFEPKS